MGCRFCLLLVGFCGFSFLVFVRAIICRCYLLVVVYFGGVVGLLVWCGICLNYRRLLVGGLFWCFVVLDCWLNDCGCLAC